MNNVPKKHASNPPGALPSGGNANNAGAPTGTQPAAPNAAPLANYTLPGVISYLTSEFTNLERFKIITNLEKSEMKYTIQKLTSEVNTLRYLNDKQAVRIRDLEARLEELGSPRESKSILLKLDSPNALDPSSSVGTSSKESASSSVGTKPDAKSKSSQGLEHDRGLDDNAASTQSQTNKIPYIDLDTVRDARQTLNESIREIIELLRPPLSAVEAVVRPAENAYGDLLETVDNFLFDASPEKPQGLFEKYTLKSEDTLAHQKAAFEDELKERNQAAENAPGMPLEESDAETVIDEEVRP